VSISPTFYEQLFRTKVFGAAFFVLEVWLNTFLSQENWWKSWPKNFGAIDYRKKIVIGHSFNVAKKFFLSLNDF
jgi:hypothetical protein